MEPFQAATLGIIQGLTEFFPVSSSGHLIIFQHLFGLKEPELLFDVSVHAGTLAAVLLYFYRDIVNILKSFFKFAASRAVNRKGKMAPQEVADVRMAMLILIGSIPTGIIGMGFYGVSEELFSSLGICGAALLVTSLLLFLTRWAKPSVAGDSNFLYRYAFLIGIMQGIAVIPGISRSGSTIAVGLYLGLSRETAARYSFLVCIPAILGALLLSFWNAKTGLSFKILFIGLITSFAAGYAALCLLIGIVRRGRLSVFAPYCACAGIAALMMEVFI
jgi:undecaprenyl-diphosphatase